MRKIMTVVRFRRRRERKTNYKVRLALLKSNTPRLVIRPSLKNIIIQLVEYDPAGDKILFTCSSRQLVKLGWKGGRKSLPAAYLTGLLCKNKIKKGTKAILDVGNYTLTKGGTIYAALKGAIDAGLDIACSPEIFPSQERLTGKHIEDYAKVIKDTEKYKKQFSNYLKQNIDPANISKMFEEVKNKILAK
ncbi:50S ribosomal protein L18 [Candidatus Woesearchaeota archaeon]|nr:50S ribosomal protein L18 [Candidatus Woesearchaeota archaeon]